MRRFFPTLPKLLHLPDDAELPLRLNHYQRCERWCLPGPARGGAERAAGCLQRGILLTSSLVPPPCSKTYWDVDFGGVPGTVQLYANSPGRSAAVQGG